MLLFGTIPSVLVEEDFEYVEKGVKVFPIIRLAFEAKREQESVFACLANVTNIAPPDIITPGDISGVLAIEKAKAIIVDNNTRSKQSMKHRASFVGMLLALFEKQTEAFSNIRQPLSVEPFINPWTMNAIFQIVDSVFLDMAEQLGITVVIPEIRVEVQRSAPSILGADGNPTGQKPKIII